MKTITRREVQARSKVKTLQLRRLLHRFKVPQDQWPSWGLSLIQSDPPRGEDNAHLIVAKMNRKGRPAIFIPQTLCGEEMDQDVGPEPNSIFDDSDMREFIAECQNRGIKVCGACASSLFDGK